MVGVHHLSLESTIGKLFKPLNILKKTLDKAGLGHITNKVIDSIEAKIDAGTFHTHQHYHGKPNNKPDSKPSNTNGDGCFIGSTPVHIKDGTQSIRTLELGDIVLAQATVH